MKWISAIKEKLGAPGVTETHVTDRKSLGIQFFWDDSWSEGKGKAQEYWSSFVYKERKIAHSERMKPVSAQRKATHQLRGVVHVVRLGPHT